jgi:RNA polymerase sigma-70 factor (ECF subfamily)
MPVMSKVRNLNEAPADWARLIEAVALRRDRMAFASLFEYFAPRIKTFMLRSGASETAADDLAQETMLAVWRKAELFDSDTAGSAAWIFTIARNRRIDSLRREGRRLHNKATDIDIEFLLDKAPLPDSVLAATQVEERVRIALSKLSVEQQRVVELSFYQERAHAEIAKDLGIPLGTVKSRLRLSMGKLRSLLGELS